MAGEAFSLNRHIQEVHDLVRASAGQAVVELALCLPLLLLITAGVLDLSRAFYFADAVVGAARAGTEWASVNSSQSGAITSIQNAALADASNLSGLTATASAACQCDDGTGVSCSSGHCSSGAVRTYVTVSTSYGFQTLGVYPYIARPLTLTGLSRVRVQ